MGITDLALIDFLMLGLDVLLILSGIIIFSRKGNSMRKCKVMIIEEKNLQTWRYALYGSIASAWLAAFFTFNLSSIIKTIFHLTFSLQLLILLRISLPTWVCKHQGYGGMCNCDLYRYNDFYPMIGLGVIGTLFLAFIDLSPQIAFTLILLFSALSLGLAFLLPEKEIKPLEYPPELLINDVDELQAFLMTNPHDRKLLTVVKPTCDFCKIQVDELNRVPRELLRARLRIFDLANEEIDPIMGVTLNIHDISKVPVPSTRVYDGGMETDLMEGVVSSTEIEGLLI